MKHGVLIGRHRALSVCQQNVFAIIRKSSTTGAGSTVFEAKSSTLCFFFLASFLPSHVQTFWRLTGDLPGFFFCFVTAAHHREQPLSEWPGMYRNIISRIGDTTKLPPYSVVSFYIYPAHLKSKRPVSETRTISSVGTLCTFPVIDCDQRMPLNLIRLGPRDRETKLPLLTRRIDIDYKCSPIDPSAPLQTSCKYS